MAILGSLAFLFPVRSFGTVVARLFFGKLGVHIPMLSVTAGTCACGQEGGDERGKMGGAAAGFALWTGGTTRDCEE